MMSRTIFLLALIATCFVLTQGTAQIAKAVKAYLLKQESESRQAKQYSGYACEKESVTLRCFDRIIQVDRVFYGRKDKSICNPFKDDLVTCGYPPRTTPLAKKKCDGKSECTISATNDAMGHDPCPKHFKYMQVYYSCYSKLTITKKALSCQGTTLSISCPSELTDIGYSIEIMYAMYGRNDWQTCKNGILLTDSCGSFTESMEIVRKNCDYKTSCSIDVKSSTFGTKCPGTWKYLEVMYRCTDIAASNRISARGK